MYKNISFGGMKRLWEQVRTGDSGEKCKTFQTTAAFGLTSSFKWSSRCSLRQLTSLHGQKLLFSTCSLSDTSPWKVSPVLLPQTRGMNPQRQASSRHAHRWYETLAEVWTDRQRETDGCEMWKQKGKKTTKNTHSGTCDKLWCLNKHKQTTAGDTEG